MLLLPLVAAGIALARERRSSGRAATSRAGWLWVLATASVVAAVVHAMVAPEHFGESGLYGTFFVATTVAGLAYAVAVLAKPVRAVH